MDISQRQLVILGLIYILKGFFIYSLLLRGFIKFTHDRVGRSWHMSFLNMILSVIALYPLGHHDISWFTPSAMHWTGFQLQLQ